MKYHCNICDYSTTDRPNFCRHNLTSKHLKKTEDIKKAKKIIKKAPAPKSLKIWKCEFCDKIFKFSSGYYKHIKDRCKEKDKKKIIPAKDVEIVKLQMDNIKKDAEIAALKKDVEIATLKKEVEMNKKTFDLMHNENDFHKTLTVNSGKMVGKSLSTIAFAMQNFQNAKPLRAIEHDEFKRLVYAENYGKMPHKNKIITDYEVSEIITGFFRHNNLGALLNAVVVTFLQDEEQELQAIWSSDVSRQTYIINRENMKIMKGEMKKVNRWEMDKCGVKVTEIVIKPMLSHIDKMMAEHICDVHALIDKNGSYLDNRHAEELEFATGLRTALITNKIPNDLIKSMAPHFYLDKNLLDE